MNHLFCLKCCISIHLSWLGTCRSCHINLQSLWWPVSWCCYYSFSANPCHINNGGCVHTCIPLLHQKHRCECRSGFRLVGNTSCEDIDECAAEHPVCSQVCTNLKGTFKCTCFQGYEYEHTSGYCKVIGEFNNNILSKFCFFSATIQRAIAMLPVFLSASTCKMLGQI